MLGSEGQANQEGLQAMLSAYTAGLGHTGWLGQVHINGTPARMASLSCCLDRFGRRLLQCASSPLVY